MTNRERSDLVCRLALEMGFDRAGTARAEPVGRLDYLESWLERGRHGEMEYLKRHHSLRADPRMLLDGARSVVVVAHNYRQAAGSGGAGEERSGVQVEQHRGGGRVAQYAWGRDYHKVMRRKLRQLVEALRREVDEPFDARICVDTAPVLEREVAATAGIGWIGKNTLVMHPELGSYFFLGEILTTLELEPPATVADHCGSCTRCLDACPTGALTAPYQMDATRCISYLTIEHRGPIDPALQTLMSEWVYGCDICQEVCPHNQRSPASHEPLYAPDGRNPLVPRALTTDVLSWDEDARRKHLAGSAMKRASLPMLHRNAAIVARNHGGNGAASPRIAPAAASGSLQARR